MSGRNTGSSFEWQRGKWRKTATTLAGTLMISLAILHASNGDLDLTFGVDGKVTNNFGGYNVVSRALAIDSHRRIVVTGQAGFPQLFLARYNPDGTLDTSFGADGMVDNPGFAIDSAAIDQDDSVVVVGFTRLTSSVFPTSIARYLQDGTPDTNFGTGGRVLTPCDQEQYSGVAIDGLGRILVAGTSRADGKKVFCLVRYNHDGSPDRTFGTDGYATAAFADDAVAMDVAIGPGGEIDVAGSAYRIPNYVHGAVARFTVNGTLDQAFGTSGTLQGNFAAFDVAYDVAIDNEGRTVVVGLAGPDVNHSDVLVARYLANGTLDTDFNGNGWTIVDVSGQTTGWSGSATVAIDRCGRIVTAGVVSNDYAEDFAVVRLNSDGSLDSSFGASGIVRTDFDAMDDGAQDIAIDPDGSVVVVGGMTGAASGNWSIALARYQSGPRYTFGGFVAPVDDAPALNVIKAGRAVPLKFSLSGNQGLDILAAGSPTSHPIACASAANVEVIPEALTAATSGLSYDATTDQYTYVWKTDKAWANSCRQLVITLNDGSTHVANFQLSR